MTTVDQRLERLTQEALQAARQGRWDQVITYYAKRVQDDEFAQVSPQMATQLMKWDQWMIRQVKCVQSALHQQILEVQEQRRRLAGMSRQYGIENVCESVHHLHTI